MLGIERRRQWSVVEKVGMVRETYEPRITVSLVAGKHGIKRLLGKKTLEAGILKEAMDVVRDRKWLARSPSLPGDNR